MCVVDDVKLEFDDVHQVKDGSSFVEVLAKYYSGFLSTNFKKGSLPKRRFQTRDKKGRRSGITKQFGDQTLKNPRKQR